MNTRIRSKERRNRAASTKATKSLNKGKKIQATRTLTGKCSLSDFSKLEDEFRRNLQGLSVCMRQPQAPLTAGCENPNRKSWGTPHSDCDRCGSDLVLPIAPILTTYICERRHHGSANRVRNDPQRHALQRHPTQLRQNGSVRPGISLPRPEKIDEIRFKIDYGMVRPTPLDASYDVSSSPERQTGYTYSTAGLRFDFLNATLRRARRSRSNRERR